MQPNCYFIFSFKTELKVGAGVELMNMDVMVKLLYWTAAETVQLETPGSRSILPFNPLHLIGPCPDHLTSLILPDVMSRCFSLSGELDSV